MTIIISLNGDDWQCKPYLGLDWQMRGAHKATTRDGYGWLPATVPGSVQHDLWQAGEIADPYIGRNSLSAEWASQRTWVYRKTFTVDEAYRGQRAYLRFAGVDYDAEFFLNGESLGRHRGMFTPAEFEVSHRLRFDGENVLAVVIEPAPHEQPQIGRTSLVQTRKARMNYWWDFCPRLVHLGIWDRVSLEFTGAARIADVWARPRLNADFTQATVDVQTTLDCVHATTLALSVVLRDPAGAVIAEYSELCRVQHHAIHWRAELAVPAPQLWWPNGYGAQPLYTAEVRVEDLETGSDAPSATRTVTFGIRAIEFVPNATPDVTARSYTLTVNGRACYIKGWNWVPMDVLYGGERPAKLERLLTLAQRAHVNLLRVWGGGLIEKETFYDLCDRLGILVWQEFTQSSSGIDNIPPDDAAFIADFVAEAEQIIPRKRNHPALAIWCGGNELMWTTGAPLDERHPLLAVLRDAVARLDPDRYWLPTSSSGPEFSNGLDVIARNPLGMHDVHGPWEHQGLVKQFTLYNAGQSLFHSEFGVEGLTNLRVLNRVIPPEHQEPVSLENPYWLHLAAWWVKAPVWEEMCGPITDVGAAVRATQYTQASGLQYAVEADRRRKWQNSGTLPWQFNEPYPMAACTSAVDYDAQPKPVYYAVAHAYEPLHVSAKFARQVWAGETTFEAEIWASNSHLADVDAILSVQIRDAYGKPYLARENSVTICANAATRLDSVTFELAQLEGVHAPADVHADAGDYTKADGLFFLDLHLRTREGQTLSENRYLFTREANFAALPHLPFVLVDADIEPDGDVWHLTLINNGDVVAPGVWLEKSDLYDNAGYAYFDANYFTLFPGETRAVTMTWDDVPPSARGLVISGWNAVNTQY